MNNQKKGKCQICGREFSFSKLFPGELVRSTISEFIRKQYPEWVNGGYICSEDLRKFRNEHIENLIREDRGELSDLDQMVIDSFKEHEVLTENVNKQFERDLTFGERLSDKVARFGGSWKFIVLFFFILFLWMGVNTIGFIKEAFDPYPFIFLNLFLSCLAAIQAPIIMMSQNRHAAKDRLKDDDDYCTNLKTELEIRQLHTKIDIFMKKQWERLLEIQQIQLDLVEELLERKHRKK